MREPREQNGWRPRPWQIGAIAAASVLFLIAVISVVRSMQSKHDPETKGDKPITGKVEEPLADKVEEPPRFGPGTFDLDKAREEAAAKRKIPSGRAYISVPIRREGDFFFTAATINGQPAGNFLIDTGAAATAIKSTVAEKLKLPEGEAPQRIRAVGGGQTASFRKIDTLHIGDVKFDGMQLVVIDLKPWEAQVGARFDGVIGCDVWRELLFAIDPESLNLTFYDRDRTTLTDRTAAEFLTVIDDRPFVGVRINGGKEVQCMAATGCGYDLMLKPDNRAEQGGATGSDAAVDLGSKQAGSTRVLGQTLEDLSVMTGPMDDVYITSDPRQTGVIGGHVLANFKLFMDFQRNKVFAQRVGGKSSK